MELEETTGGVAGLRRKNTMRPRSTRMIPNSSLTKNRITIPIMASASPNVRLWRLNGGPVEAPMESPIDSNRMNRSLRLKGSASEPCADDSLPARTVTLSPEPWGSCRATKGSRAPFARSRRLRRRLPGRPKRTNVAHLAAGRTTAPQGTRGSAPSLEPGGSPADKGGRAT